MEEKHSIAKSTKNTTSERILVFKLDIEGNEMEKERIIDILEKESEFEKVSATYLFMVTKEWI